MQVWWCLLTVAAFGWGYGKLARGVARRDIEPSLGFWILILLANLVFLASMLASHVVGTTLTLLLAWTTGSILISVLTYRQRNSWRFTVGERMCAVLTIASLAFWWVSQDAGYAIVVQALGTLIIHLQMWTNGLRGHERWQPFIPHLVGSITSFGTIRADDWHSWQVLLMPLWGVGASVITISCAALGRQLRSRRSGGS